ncbi:efflux RND transporter periplasmic adaptor subunit [Marinobacter sp. G11]|jgi:multidrug efflux system membrane fusion protein|uniref:efflux RND transporter periplasmic adaptor subunit n=2 Tax=unclassified Marinobacter TaxID=83889 RepID=UPI001E3B5EBD|nr:efflux RND transporter periplasmic adaptor subunit [Marinobacter sp. G11]MCE0760490.1 efflux RND transporter periplasmic adaptor subunit [Marinobacter sp. G11]|tara:strand:- start:4998 stop:6197 length:1200 start_codon:yes stop_codon:yes gene_type:complete
MKTKKVESMRYRFLVALSAAVFILAGCDNVAQNNVSDSQPPAVEVVAAARVGVQPQKTYTTRIEAPENVVLRPRLSGVIDRVHFQEGQRVNKGDVLFQLDDRHLKARVEQLNSELARARAALHQAKAEAERAGRLLRSNAISEEQAELRESVRRQAEAEVSSLNAQLKEAELQLGYATIRSPIEGDISRANITAGNTVIANQSRLTTIASNQDRYTYFDMDESTWYRFFQTRDQALGSPVRIQLIGESNFSHVGEIDFVDNSIDSDTGTLRLRAVLSDSGGTLVPGAFARVKIAVAGTEQKILVPDRAIATDLDSRFVLTVNDHGETRYTPVEIGQRYGTFRVVEQGIAEGDLLVANGAAKVGPDMKIAPTLLSEAPSDIAFTLEDHASTVQQTAGVEF